MPRAPQYKTRPSNNGKKSSPIVFSQAEQAASSNDEALQRARKPPSRRSRIDWRLSRGAETEPLETAGSVNFLVFTFTPGFHPARKIRRSAPRIVRTPSTPSQPAAVTLRDRKASEEICAKPEWTQCTSAHRTQKQISSLGSMGSGTRPGMPSMRAATTAAASPEPSRTLTKAV